MKFWTLVSFLRREPDALRLVVEDPRWLIYAGLLNDCDRLVRVHDRSVLDAELPAELCIEALRHSDREYRLRDGVLTWANSAAGVDAGPGLSAVDVFTRFGGEVLEEVEEYGSAKVKSPSMCKSYFA
jgi:hypothetical protein